MADPLRARHEHVQRWAGRRGRRARVVAVGVATVLAGAVLVAVILVAVTASPSGKHRGATVASTARTASAPSNELLVLSNGALQIRSAQDGGILHTVHLQFKLGPLTGPMAVSGDGRTVYLDSVGSTTCPTELLLGVNLAEDNGGAIAGTEASQSGVAPAVSPDGTHLAYLNTSTARACTENQVVVNDLAETDATRIWQIAPPELVTSVSWMPDGTSLLLGTVAGPASGIQVLDTTKPVSDGNPRTIGASSPFTAGTRYQDPTMLANGTIVALADACTDRCTTQTFTPTAVVTLDPKTGRPLTTLVDLRAHPGLTFRTLIVDPSRERIAALDGTDLYDITDGHRGSSLTGSTPPCGCRRPATPWRQSCTGHAGGLRPGPTAPGPDRPSRAVPDHHRRGRDHRRHGGHRQPHRQDDPAQRQERLPRRLRRGPDRQQWPAEHRILRGV